MAESGSSSSPKGVTNVQELLRFLAQDAKLPLSIAMSQAARLQKASMGSPEAIASSKLDALTSALQLDAKQVKQVWNAAKRVSKKRQNPDEGESTMAKESQSRKRTRTSKSHATEPESQEEIELALALPLPEVDVDAISDTVLVTNRAPLMLAFAVVLLEYTMPEQPLSSRLSLAQAVVSTGAQKKAISLGLEQGPGAEEEGWGEGQPVVRIMGRDISVMKRGDYELRPKHARSDIDGESSEAPDGSRETALWGLDLEALKKSNGPPVPSMHSANRASLPIYHASSARNYLYRAFGNQVSASASTNEPKKRAKGAASDSERNLALLLGAIKLLYDSWEGTLDLAELNRRAFGWYIRSRPDVDQGIAGWGGKGEVTLKDILDLRREAAE